MTRRLLFGYLAVTAVVLVLLEVPLGVTFARREREALVGDVRRDAESTARFATGPLSAERPEALRDVAEAYRAETGGRLVVVDEAGRSVADSDERTGRDFSTRPEIQVALRGDELTGVRTSESLGQRLLVAAVPVNPGGEVVGAVRITYPYDIVEDRIRRSWLILGGVAVVTLVAVSLLGWWLARSLAQPIREIEGMARRLGQGELGARAPMPRGPPELRHLAEELNEAAGRIQQLRAAQEAFLADASHQLRTPLTALRLRLENIEAADAANEDVVAALAEIGRLSRIVNGVLHLARADATIDARPTVVDLDLLVRERTEAWQPVAEDRDVTIVIRAAGGRRALATPDHLHQVLDNLIANALDVSPTGGRVWLTIGSADGWIEIHVSDEGPGMPADQRATASDRFTNRSGTSSGFGLGLAIASRLLDIDGGRLDLLDASTGGLDARIRLRPAR